MGILDEDGGMKQGACKGCRASPQGRGDADQAMGRRNGEGSLQTVLHECESQLRFDVDSEGGEERRRWSVELRHGCQGQSDVCLQLFVVNWCGRGDVGRGGRGVRGECCLQSALGESSRVKATYLLLFELGQIAVESAGTGHVVDSNRRRRRVVARSSGLDKTTNVCPGPQAQGRCPAW